MTSESPCTSPRDERDKCTLGNDAQVFCSHIYYMCYKTHHNNIFILCVEYAFRCTAMGSGALHRVCGGDGGGSHRRRFRFFLSNIGLKKSRSRDVLRIHGTRLGVARRPLLLANHVRRRAVSAVAVAVAAVRRSDDRRIDIVVAVGRTRSAHLKR